jgi:hypothetical protein
MAAATSAVDGEPLSTRLIVFSLLKIQIRASERPSGADLGLKPRVVGRDQTGGALEGAAERRETGSAFDEGAEPEKART